MQDPAWQAEKLGQALPDSAHACSVCLPTWASIVGYEEGDEAVVGKMQAGYPRFFINPLVEELRAKARDGIGLNRSDCLPFPSKAAAGRAQRFVERLTGQAGRLEQWEGLYFVVVPHGEPLQRAREYWRYTGEIVSSRMVEDLLAGKLDRSTDAVESLKFALAKLQGSVPTQLHLYPSGMAGLFAAHRAIMGLHRSKPTLQLEFPYTDLFNIQANFGSGVEFPDLTEEGAWERQLVAIREGEFAAVFTEVPSNPLCRCVNLQELSEACRESATPLVVDDTIASEINVNVRPYADLVTSSLTKWHAGTGDVIAGQVWVNPRSEYFELFSERLAERALQVPLYSRDARELESRLGGLSERIGVINESAMEVYQLLVDHPAVEEVWYPFATCRESYDLIKRPNGGYGGLMSMVLKDRAKTSRFYDALRLSKGPSLGTNFTLVCPYTLLAHYEELDWAAERGVARELIRISVGLEDVATLKSAFLEALEAI